ncbi:alpha/beta hydrolase [Hyphobacterium sp.]|uniref:alpha/beta hydrolase n=1 Tax=Hyphobacterium sp. TaxID=2004662 RepID=UPI003747E35A
MIENALIAIGFVMALDGAVECPESESYCILDTEIPAEVLAEQLQGLDETYWVEGNTLFAAARRESESVFFCCAVQTSMRRAGDSDYWYVAVEVPRISEAILDIFPIPFDLPGRRQPFQPLEYWGPDAPPRVDRNPVTEIHVTDQAIDSESLNAIRQISIYEPPELAGSENHPVVFLADGQGTGVFAAIAQSLIEACRIEPVLLVGLWHGNVEGEHYPGNASDPRSHDYLWGVDGGHFEQYEAFFLNDVMPLVERRYNASDEPSRRALFGNSSGGAWALSTGLRNPETFGTIAAASTVWRRSINAAPPTEGPRYIFTTGLLDQRAQTALDDIMTGFAETGADHESRTLVAGHSPLVAYRAFADLLLSEFPAAEDAGCGPDE